MEGIEDSPLVSVVHTGSCSGSEVAVEAVEVEPGLCLDSGRFECAIQAKFEAFVMEVEEAGIEAVDESAASGRMKESA